MWQGPLLLLMPSMERNDQQKRSDRVAKVARLCTLLSFVTFTIFNIQHKKSTVLSTFSSHVVVCVDALLLLLVEREPPYGVLALCHDWGAQDHACDRLLCGCCALVWEECCT